MPGARQFRARALASLLAGASACACTGSGPARSDAGLARPDAADARPSYLPDLNAITCDPSLASIQANVFEVACGFDSCHGRNNAAWGLYLTVPDVDRHLVSVASATCKGWQLVVPGSPERSLLYDKIAHDEPACGERMPFGLGRLPSAVIACVHDYIAALAADASTP